jgi:hypothetical protein
VLISRSRIGEQLPKISSGNTWKKKKKKKKKKEGGDMLCLSNNKQCSNKSKNETRI